MALTKVHSRMQVGNPINVFDFMAQAQIDDVVARTQNVDVTSAVQAALDAVPNNGALYLPYGVYSVGNITIPNKRMSILGDGQYQTVLVARSGAVSNTKYLIASSSYVGNSTSGCDPIYVDGIGFSGNGITENVFVLYGYFSELTDCRFTGPASGTGAALRITSDGISGSACSSTLVENKVMNCRIDGSSSGFSFIMSSAGQKTTDMNFTDNLVFGGNAAFTSMAGMLVSGNHFYACTPTFNRLSIGTIITENYFENTVTFDDFINDIVYVNDNCFLQRVTVSFGNAGQTICMDGNNFQSSADLYHNYFAPKHIIVNGGSFNTATPVVFSSGVSTGRVTFNNVWSQAGGYILEGSRTANTGLIYKKSWAAAAPTTGTWAVGDRVFDTSPSAGGHIGWVCTTAGTPGTWKTFGAITA